VLSAEIRTSRGRFGGPLVGINVAVVGNIVRRRLPRGRLDRRRRRITCFLRRDMFTGALDGNRTKNPRRRNPGARVLRFKFPRGFRTAAVEPCEPVSFYFDLAGRVRGTFALRAPIHPPTTEFTVRFATPANGPRAKLVTERARPGCRTAVYDCIGYARTTRLFCEGKNRRRFVPVGVQRPSFDRNQ